MLQCSLEHLALILPNCLCFVYSLIVKLFLFYLFFNCQAISVLSILFSSSCLCFVYSLSAKLSFLCLLFYFQLSLFCKFFDCQAVFLLSTLWLPSCLCFVYSLTAKLFLFSLFPDCQAGLIFLYDLGRSLIFPSIAFFFSTYFFPIRLFKSAL